MIRRSHFIPMGTCLTIIFFLLIGITSYGQHDVPTSRSQGRSVEDFLYIENETLKLGIDTSMGGAITYLNHKKYEENMVNNFDLGRQIQISFFGGPVPFAPSPDKQPHQRWVQIGWNPIQAGDVFGYGSKVLDLYLGTDSIFVSCIPMHWPLENVPGQCVYESSIKLSGNKVFASVKIVNNRKDTIQYRARNNEFPAIYSNGTYYRLCTYTNDEPFTNGEMTVIPKRNVKPNEFPWSRFQATENWAALVNDDGIGMGVYSPVTQQFLGGFSGEEGQGSTFDIPCGYICPVGSEVLDHNIEYEYQYVIVCGKLDEIRKDIYELAQDDRVIAPCFDFKESRQSWYYKNARDTGWPVSEILEITPLKNNFGLVGPDISFEAKNVTRLEITAAFESAADSFSFSWKKIAGSNKFKRGNVKIDIKPGSGFHTYQVDLKGVKDFDGLISGLALNFENFSLSDKVKIDKICFK